MEAQNFLHNQQALSSSIEEGLRMQAMHRFGGEEKGGCRVGGTDL